MSTLTIDIETLPAEWDEATRTAMVRDAVPANYKDPDKIAAWCLAEGDKVHRRTAFDGMAGRLLCIGYAIDDGEPCIAYDGTGNQPGVLLESLYLAIKDLRSPTWVGHNLAAFDLPWLKWHAWRLGHPVAGLIPFERFSPRIADTMLLWQGPNGREHTRLSAIADFLGLGAKHDGLDGSKVYDAWLNGEHGRIATYCKQDVALTRSIYHRMTGAPVLEAAAK